MRALQQDPTPEKYFQGTPECDLSDIAETTENISKDGSGNPPLLENN